MDRKYKPLNQDEINEDDNTRTREWKPAENDITNEKPTNRARFGIWASICIIVLILSNIISVFALLGSRNWKQRSDASPPPPEDYPILPNIPTKYNRFLWNTEYSSQNVTEKEELWNNIIWEHGMIAVNYEWAKSQNWPDSIAWVKDELKSVYLLEAYHELHCLGVLRKIMDQSLAGADFSQQKSVQPHIDHCFDYLLQVITCNADATPLNTSTGTVVGRGHQHKCKDWNALRDYATEHSACFLTVTDSSASDSSKDNFGHCSNGDGLIIGGK